MKELLLNGSAMQEKLAALRLVHTDGVNWMIYYIDDGQGEKWVKEYPHSEMHGGGPPQLRWIEKFPWED